jgi:hypothetical protein
MMTTEVVARRAAKANQGIRHEVVWVDVTAEDVRSGQRAVPTHCPIALALARATGDVWSVGTGVAYRLVGAHCVVNLPENAARFIRAFDSGDRSRLLHRSPVRPFKFQLEVWSVN